MGSASESPDNSTLRRRTLVVAGAAGIGLGIIGITFGSLWAPAALALFSGNAFARNFELIVPFFPILLIASGAALVVRSGQH
jgi:hypothetical protein